LEKTFEVGVAIRAYDYMTGPMTKMSAQMGTMSAQAEAMQAKLTSLKNMAMVGAGLTVVGAGLAYGLVKAADAYGQLQASMMGVKNALGLTNAEFEKAINLAQTTGIPTIFAATDVGGIMQAMATSGLTKQAVLNPDLLQEYVNFADVQKLQKGENAPDVTADAVKMAHQYQLYSGAQVSPFLNQLNAALMHTHDTASEFATTFKYVATTGKVMGMSFQDALATTAWLSRMGLGSGRGGTNFQDFLTRSIYGSSGKKADESMIAAGFVHNGHSVFENAQGAFVGIPESVKIMQDFSKRFRGDANVMVPLLKNIFGLQGERVAMIMASPGAAGLYTGVQQQMRTSPTVNQMQAAQNATWGGQTKQLVSTLHDIFTAFGKNVAPALLPLLTNLNKVLAVVLRFVQTHSPLMRFIVVFTSIASAAMLVVGPLMLLGAGIGYLKNLGLIVTVIRAIGTAFSGLVGPLIAVQVAGGPILWVIEGLILIVAALWLAWRNNWGNIRGHWAATVKWVTTEWAIVQEFFRNLPAEAMQWGDSFIKGFVQGIVRLESWLKTQVSNFFRSNVVDPVKHFLGISSPSRLMAQFGQYTALGFAQGMTGNLHYVSRAASQMAAAAIPGSSMPKLYGGQHNGDINIIIQSNQDPKAIAREVIKELGRTGRKISYGRPAEVLTVY